MIIAFFYFFFIIVPYLIWKYMPFGRRSLKKKTVLITGAGSGLGRKMAIFAALKKNCNLILLDLRQHFLDDVKKEIMYHLSKQNAPQVRIECHVCDVSNEENVTSVIESLGSPIDVLINNAGIVFAKDIDEITPKEFKRALEVNAYGPFLLTKAILPHFKERGTGYIVNISSVMGHVGCAKLSEYCASKHALVGFHESLKLELMRDGYSQKTIGCLLVCPSAINTGMFDGLFQTWLMRTFSPLLKEDYVADQVLTAIERGDHVLYLPQFASVFFPIARLLPTPIKDYFTGHFGGYNGISKKFKGRGSSFSLGEDIQQNGKKYE